ncbi:hypothetical protein V6X63_09990 [Spiribacter sp. 221]|uniref:hypothetical protein n=1 Tax=Spiribacter onubensis TaxID=3122420 RepID=UPI00349F151F
MELFVHIGTEKTGSSHLQTLAAQGRASLVAAGVCMPKGWLYDERCMAGGQISAGNARLLAQAIESDRVDEQQTRFRDCHQAARDRDCDHVLLTSEHLLPALSKSKRLEAFEAAAEKAGFAATHYLVILRDPIAQCLSLYKHRAKRGAAGEIADWVEKGYRLPPELRGFREQAEQLGITPTVRGYTREPGGLEKRFFEDWLGVSTPAVDMPATVNPSLTLSELILIKQMAERRPALVEPLYDALLAIDPAEKVQGSALEAHAKAVATAAVAAHADEWAAWNRLLPADEALPIPAPPAEIPPRPRELGLTDRQMAALAAVVDELSSITSLAGLLWRERLRPLFAWVRASLAP